MVDSPSLVLAFVAGLASFVSPCCLPLLPGYLAAVSGVSTERLDSDERRGVLGRSLAFVATFSAVFVVLGLSATALGAFLLENQSTLNRAAGIAIIAMGVLFAGPVFVPRLSQEWRPRGLVERAGSGGPIVVGAAFAIAWTPCVGPTLGAILSLSATAEGTGRGALLLGVYSAGLAVPFLFSATAFSRAVRIFSWFKRHYAVVQLASGVLLVAMGVLVYSGELFRLNIEAQQALDSLGLNFWKNI
jgi:cytochrome c-type biogenesis protein